MGPLDYRPGPRLQLGGRADAHRGPQYGWEAGVSSLWAAPCFGPLLNFGIIARRMRRYTEKTKSLTIPDFFGHRYYSQGVKLLSVIIMPGSWSSA